MRGQAIQALRRNFSTFGLIRIMFLLCRIRIRRTCSCPSPSLRISRLGATRSLFRSTMGLASRSRTSSLYTCVANQSTDNIMVRQLR